MNDKKNVDVLRSVFTRDEIENLIKVFSEHALCEECPILGYCDTIKAPTCAEAWERWLQRKVVGNIHEGVMEE